MNDGIDIYRLIGICGIVVAGWVAQVMGLHTFMDEVRDGPPRMNVVDFDKDFSGEDAQRPLVEVARERGWDVNAMFVTPEEARRRIADHERKKWLGLFAGIGGVIVVFWSAYRLWGDWLTALVCVVAGPVGIAWGIHRSN